MLRSALNTETERKYLTFLRSLVILDVRTVGILCVMINRNVSVDAERIVTFHTVNSAHFCNVLPSYSFDNSAIQV